MKILIVDDSKAMRMIVKRNVSQVQAVQGAEIIEAENGATALAYFENGQAPDLVLSDWNMPELDGMGFLAALRERGITVPFGFVTAERDEQHIADALAAGAQFVIAKPFTVETFADRFAEIGLS